MSDCSPRRHGGHGEEKHRQLTTEDTESTERHRETCKEVRHRWTRIHTDKTDLLGSHLCLSVWIRGDFFCDLCVLRGGSRNSADCSPRHEGHGEENAAT